MALVSSMTSSRAALLLPHTRTSAFRWWRAWSPAAGRLLKATTTFASGASSWMRWPHEPPGRSCSAIAPLLPKRSALTTETTTLPASASAIGGMVASMPSHGIETTASSPAAAASTFSRGVNVQSGRPSASVAAA